VVPQLETPAHSPVSTSPSLRPEQEITRLRDLLSWVSDNAKCIETRKFVARELRLIDAAKTGKPVKEKPTEREKRPT